MFFHVCHVFLFEPATQRGSPTGRSVQSRPRRLDSVTTNERSEWRKRLPRYIRSLDIFGKIIEFSSCFSFDSWLSFWVLEGKCPIAPPKVADSFQQRSNAPQSQERQGVEGLVTCAELHFSLEKVNKFWESFGGDCLFSFLERQWI